MNAKINLTRFTADPSIVVGDQHVWPVRVQARGYNIPSEIFVYRSGQVGDPNESPVFSCIASVVQLDEIPSETVVGLDNTSQVPWFRTSELRVVCRSPEEAAEVWNIVRQDVMSLVDNYNLSFALRSCEQVSISGANQIVTDSTMKPPTRVQLFYNPAGAADIVNDVPVVVNPNTGLAGWLPVSAAPSGWAIPPGALFFYNISQDDTLESVWPPQEPYAGNQLHRNGVLLPYGVTHVITKDTIWWLNFDPETVVGYGTGAMASKSPWPTDYTDSLHPGANSPIIEFEIYK